MEKSLAEKELWTDTDHLSEVLPPTALIGMSTVVGRWYRRSILRIEKLEGGIWAVRYVNPTTGISSISFTGQTMREPMVDMVIFLAESGIIAI